jgi:cell division protein FtsW
MKGRAMSKEVKWFTICLILICFVGLLMVYSSSYIYAKEEFGTSLYFIKKQLFFCTIGVVTCLIISKSKINFWIKYSLPISLFFFALLAMTQVPGLSVYLKGSNRWLRMGSIQFQPGEFAKIGILLSATHFFQFYKGYNNRELSWRVISILGPLIVMLIQPDFGMFALSTVFIIYICFLSNFSRKVLYSSAIVAAATLVGLIFAAPYRVKRLFIFLDPWSDPKNAGFQIIQSYLAFAHGHLTGMGLGNSNEKLFYLPEAHNDFIFSVIGEELGFIGVLMVLVCYLGMIFWGFRNARKLKGSNQHLAITIIFMFGFQAFTNIAVVIGMLPTKGLNLPFISYGGSSLVSNFILLGLYYACLQNREIELLTYEEEAQNNPKSIYNRPYELGK